VSWSALCAAVCRDARTFISKRTGSSAVRSKQNGVGQKTVCCSVQGCMMHKIKRMGYITCNLKQDMHTRRRHGCKNGKHGGVRKRKVPHVLWPVLSFAVASSVFCCRIFRDAHAHMLVLLGEVDASHTGLARSLYTHTVCDHTAEGFQL